MDGDGQAIPGELASTGFLDPAGGLTVAHPVSRLTATAARLKLTDPPSRHTTDTTRPKDEAKVHAPLIAHALCSSMASTNHDFHPPVLLLKDRRGIFVVQAHSNSSQDACVGSGYIDEFEYIDDHRSGKIVVQLNGRINKCGVVSPRFNVPLDQIENWVDRLMPARSFGIIILTTSAGIMDHEEARRKHVAGKILGYVF
ncbi:40S ribosomal protein S22 [Puccinia graminis f. sp. tritici]|uniref:40S ribosomal protein S22 n=1 Tax=Puccinia graminis f. sp. tritici TaxID=56615 RepID=A0A5B0MZA0_PUCGR|nr:40S ribosomal protein S22 [Puccinia graminis f. sp. tritici]